MKSSANDLKLLNDVIQNYTLIDGEYELREALEILISLFDSKINHHKIQKMMKWSRDSDNKAVYDSTRIDQLIHDKNEILEMLKSVDKGSKIKLHSVLQIVNIK